jgi:hypothetical protein
MKYLGRRNANVVSRTRISATTKGIIFKKVTEYNGKLYKPGAGEKIFLDHAHHTSCDETCLLWKNQFLKG